MLKKCNINYIVFCIWSVSDIKQFGWDMYGVNTYIFCAYTVKLRDSYNILKVLSNNFVCNNLSADRMMCTWPVALLGEAKWL